MKLRQARKRAASIALCFLATHVSAQSAWEATQHRFESEENPKQVSPVFQTLTQRATHRIVHLRAIHFNLEDAKLIVVDNPRRDETLAGAMQRCGALAGVNGGYFHADGTPVGLEVCGYETVHPFERAKLLSGVLAISAKSLSLLRAREFSPAKNFANALQAGPFLVDLHDEIARPVVGLDDSRRANRTAVIDSQLGAESHGTHLYWLVVCEPVTLAEFADILAHRLMLGTANMIRALNLDGGSSTGMWIRGQDTSDIGNPNVNVRDYLAIVPR